MQNYFKNYAISFFFLPANQKFTNQANLSLSLLLPLEVIRGVSMPAEFEVFWGHAFYYSRHFRKQTKKRRVFKMTDFILHWNLIANESTFLSYTDSVHWDNLSSFQALKCNQKTSCHHLEAFTSLQTWSLELELGSLRNTDHCSKPETQHSITCHEAFTSNRASNLEIHIELTWMSVTESKTV